MDKSDPLKLVGKQLGKVKILRKLGQGGMGVVYLGQDQALDRQVAVKVLPTNPLQQDEYHQRFLREAKSAARLEHPGIVQVYDIGQEEKLDYIVMQFVSGDPLQEVLEKQRPLPLSQALSILSQTLEALDFAHEQNIIHRDIKPDNIMITEGGEAKILDFGLAKSIEDKSLTESGVVMGTPQFMSPEQATGSEVGRASDIYSLGVTFYVMVTGVIPFDEGSAIEMILAKAQNPLPDPQKYNPQLPKEICQLLAKMTQPFPQDRYQNCRQVLSDLEGIEIGHTPIAPFSTQSTSLEEMPTMASSLAGEQRTRPRSVPNSSISSKPWWLKNPRLWIYGVVLIVGVYYLWFYQPPSKKPNPKPNTGIQTTHGPKKQRPWLVRFKDGLVLGKSTGKDVEKKWGHPGEIVSDQSGNKGWFYAQKRGHFILNSGGILMGFHPGKPDLTSGSSLAVLTGQEGFVLGKTTLSEVGKALQESFDPPSLLGKQQGSLFLLTYKNRGIRYIFDAKKVLQFIEIPRGEKNFYLEKDHIQSIFRLFSKDFMAPRGKEGNYFFPLLGYQFVFGDDYLLRGVKKTIYCRGVEEGESLEDVQKSLLPYLEKGEIQKTASGLFLKYPQRKLSYQFTQNMLISIEVAHPERTFRVKKDWFPLVSALLFNHYQELRPSPDKIELIYPKFKVHFIFRHGLLQSITKE